MTSFTVVGEFPDEAGAYDAEQMIAHLFADIVKFQEEHKYWGHNSYKETPTWPEIEVSEKYNIAWETTLDWIQLPIPEHVMRFKNFVFVTTKWIKGWKTPDRIEQLLKNLSNHIYVQTDNLPEIIILAEINCRAPERQVVIDTAAEINLYLLDKDVEYLIPPWEIYCPFLDLYDHNFLQREFGFEPDIAYIQQAIDALYRYQKAAKLAKKRSPLERVTLNALEALHTQHYTFPNGLNSGLLPELVRNIGSVSGASGRGKKVEAINQIVHIPEIWFHKPELGIPAIHAYLIAKGCTDIEIALKSVPYESKPEYI